MRRDSIRGVDEAKRNQQWLERNIKEHRYSSPTLQLRPAVSFMWKTVADMLFPLAVRSLYLSLGTAKQTGSEFAAAARWAFEKRRAVVLGDVEEEDLFDPEGSLRASKDDSLLEKVAGPFVQPEGERGVNFFKAVQHVFGGGEENVMVKAFP